MDKKEKKRIKAELKASKNTAKSNRNCADQVTSSKPSKIVRFADSVKGIIYLIFGVSLIVAIFLGEQGMVITLEDIIGSLFLATVGKAALVILALALFIYGLKQLHLVK